MDFAGRLYDFGRPAWIIAMILGFMIRWPIGLAILLYLLWSRRMGCWNHARGGRWQRWQEGGGVDRIHDAAHRFFGDRYHRAPPSSGNRAFDEYRTETLRRLEEEEKEFKEFLDQLRMAKDKVEFDQFLAERRRRAAEGGSPTQPPA